MLTLIDMFIENIELKDVSSNTTRSYRTSLEEYKKFLQSINPEKVEDELYNIDSECVVDHFVLKLKNDGKANTTINNRLAAIRRFYTFLYKRKVVDIDTREILNLYEPLKQKKTEPIYMTENEAKQFLEASKYISSKNSIRNYTIVYIMLNLGLRVSEVSNLLIENINFENLILTVEGKGSKIRYLEISNHVSKCLMEYLTFRKQLISNNNTHLFLNSKGEQLKVEGIKMVIKQTKELSGIKKEITPHKLRHTCASLLRKSGIGIDEIKEILGHESISTTTIYTHMYKGDMREAISSNPLQKI